METISCSHTCNAIDRQRAMRQQDSARPHIAMLTVDFQTQNNINVLPWSSKSPDWNQLEHLCDELDRRVHQTPHELLDRLGQALQHEWQMIPHVRIQNVIRFMSRRCRTVSAAHGGHNRY